MNATTATQAPQFLTIEPPVQEDGYTMREAGTIKLGKSKFTVRLQEFPDGEIITWLTGARGGEYTLIPTSMLKPNGTYRVISFSTGAAYRVQGNEVRVAMFGNIIEVA